MREKKKNERVYSILNGTFAVVCKLVGGQNGLNKSWTKILAETLTPLLIGIDIDN
jgi:hypothetical protein